MSTALAKPDLPNAAAIEKVLIGGDLSILTPEQRLHYYNAVCDSVGLNPLTKPFEYITLQGKMVLYARRDASEQLRKIHNVSVEKLDKEFNNDLGLYVVTAHGELPTGRRDTGTGAVAIGGLKGDQLANALMKAETKAKRRMTLSICGLGLLDETEVDSIPRAKMPRKQLTEGLGITEQDVIDVTGEIPTEQAKQENSAGKVITVDGFIEELKAFDDPQCSIAKIHGQKVVVVDENLQAAFRKYFQDEVPVTVACLEKFSPKGGRVYYEARAVSAKEKTELQEKLEQSLEDVKKRKNGKIATMSSCFTHGDYTGDGNCPKCG